MLIAAAQAEELSATEIVRRADDSWRGAQSYAKVTMTIRRPAWTRTLELEGWTQGTEMSFMRVLSPPKEKGVTFLKRGREAWQHVPAIDRTIKIPPSMMLQSWMGSDFTNDDVVRADSLVVDYDHRLVEEREKNGAAHWVIEAIPKPKAPVVWGKVVLTVRKSNVVAGLVEYFDEEGERVKYYETSDVQLIDDREVATTLVMHDVTRPGHATSLRYEDLTFRPDLDADTFTLRNLER